MVAEMETGRTVADVRQGPDGPLLAAAPDLLQALRGLMECRCGHDVLPGECCSHVRAARAAIAKAEGRD